MSWTSNDPESPALRKAFEGLFDDDLAVESFLIGAAIALTVKGYPDSCVQAGNPAARRADVRPLFLPADSVRRRKCNEK